jgi:hypothetical protein
MYYLLRDGKLKREFATANEAYEALMTRYSPACSIDHSIKYEGWEVLDEDDFQERLTQWADREGVNLSNLITDENGDDYVNVEGEEGYEKLYVDYSKIS